MDELNMLEPFMTRGAQADILKALGSEPMWAIKHRDGRLTLKTPRTKHFETAEGWALYLQLELAMRGIRVYFSAVYKIENHRTKLFAVTIAKAELR